jgi:hypothetical protein
MRQDDWITEDAPMSGKSQRSQGDLHEGPRTKSPQGSPNICTDHMCNKGYVYLHDDGTPQSASC